MDERPGHVVATLLLDHDAPSQERDLSSGDDAGEPTPLQSCFLGVLGFSIACATYVWVMLLTH